MVTGIFYNSIGNVKTMNNSTVSKTLLLIIFSLFLYGCDVNEILNESIEKAKLEQIELTKETIQFSIELYKVENERYPTTEEGVNIIKGYEGYTYTLNSDGTFTITYSAN